MNRIELFNKIQETIADITEIDASEISEDSSLMDDLSLSSLEVMTVMAQVEKIFPVKVSEKDLRSLYSVSDLLDYVEKRL